MLLCIIIILSFIYLSNNYLAKEGLFSCDCVNSTHCIDGLCICEEGWKGKKCDQQIKNACYDEITAPEKIDQIILDENNHEIKERDNHNYNNHEIQNLQQWENIQNSGRQLLNVYKRKKFHKCHGDSKCPSSQAMNINELKDWYDKLKEIREIKRCSTDFCPIKRNANKRIEIKQDGNKLLKVNTKQSEPFSNFSTPVPQEQSPTLYLGPAHTTNMFNII